MIALVNKPWCTAFDATAASSIQRKPKTLRHFSGLSDEKCDSAMFMEDDYSHESVKAAAERSTIGTFNNSDIDFSCCPLSVAAQLPPRRPLRDL